MQKQSAKRSLDYFSNGMGVLLILTLIGVWVGLVVGGPRRAGAVPQQAAASPVVWGPWKHLRPGLEVPGAPKPADWRLDRTYVRHATTAPFTACVAYATRVSLAEPWVNDIRMGFEPEWSEADYDAAFAACKNDPPQ